MTSTKRREVTKIWGILQIAGDIFFFWGGAGGGGEWGGWETLFFPSYAKFFFIVQSPENTGFLGRKVSNSCP